MEEEEILIGLLSVLSDALSAQSDGAQSMLRVAFPGDFTVRMKDFLTNALP